MTVEVVKKDMENIFDKDIRLRGTTEAKLSFLLSRVNERIGGLEVIARLEGKQESAFWARLQDLTDVRDMLVLIRC